MRMTTCQHLVVDEAMTNRRGREDLRRMSLEFKSGKSPSSPSSSSSKTLITMKLNLCKLLLCTISLHLIVLNLRPVLASYYKQNYNYDPEQQDGIPVFSARSLAKLDGEWKEGMQESMRPSRVVQRRQADNDLDDGLEEEDEDEYKSGSSPHESIESPSYGESLRFARDGDEIENFFDKHLGPPKEAVDTTDESSDQPTIVKQDTVPAIDPDDHYEAAASGPISSILQSLLGHSNDHKHGKRQPFLQISTSSPSDSDSTSAEEEPKTSLSTKGLKASQSAQSFIEAPPVTLAITPVAAPSSLSAQEPSGHEQEPLSGVLGLNPYGAADPHNSNSGGAREIYIGRRPTVMSYLQQQQQQQQQTPLHHLSSYTTAGSANVWRGPNGQPVVYEQEQANDHSRYPVAASYAYQQQPNIAAHATESAGGSSGGDDEQTVTYGLSFGGGGSSVDEPSSEQDDQPAAVNPVGSGVVESPADQQPRGYVPYNTRYTTSSTRALNNYYDNYYRQPTGYVKAYPMHPQQMIQQQPYMVPIHKRPHYPQQPQQRQQYMGNGATRYHRDPSESSTHLAAMRAALSHRGANYEQSNYDRAIQRGLGENPTGRADQEEQFIKRQRLLASLDREIKASPQYRSNRASTGDASAQRNSYLRRPSPYNGRQLVTYNEMKKNYLGDDLDTYTSYHSETDPYKTQTTTSHMVNNPSAFLTHTKQPSIGNGYGSPTNHHPASTSNHVANQSPETSFNSNQASQNAAGGGQAGSGQIDRASNGINMQLSQQPRQTNDNLLTGPLSEYDNSGRRSGQEDILRGKSNDQMDSSNDSKTNSDSNEDANSRNQGHSRVRRDDSDEREIDNDTDDDGVWVDDDGDDDNKQQSSDVNETSQYPEEEGDDDGQQDDVTNNVLTPQQINPPGVIGGPHGYELSPNDLMIYHG